MMDKIRSTIPVQVVFDDWHKDTEYRAEFAALEDEFALADQFIKARGAAGLTQQELAKKN